MRQSPAVPFASLDTAATARALSQIADQPDDLADVFFERRQQIRLPPEGSDPGFQVWREQGLAVRLVRGRRAWLASRDGIETYLLGEALRQVARAFPVAAYPEPEIEPPTWGPIPEATELATFVSGVHRALRSRHVAFPLQISLSRHERWIQVVGAQFVADPQQELFYSCEARLPWARFGTLLTDLGGATERGAAERSAEERVAEALLASFRARQAPPPEAFQGPVVLAPEATAVLLHETVAHALEADTLALGGKPDSALGVPLGCAGLHVLDDPTNAPGNVRRTTDDEGNPSTRRWLLRDGVVEQPLSDAAAAQRYAGLTPGSGRRGTRHQPPVPRSTHLEVLPGDQSLTALLANADGGLYVEQVARGQLDPLTGRFQLYLPFARRIRGGEIADPVGPCRLQGTVSDALSRIAGIGRDTLSAGAGWCAKGGQKLPVWATAPALLLDRIEVEP